MTLADQIEENIVSHFVNGRIPCKLTVAALSAHYGVSSTPIREVISRLLKNNRVIKLENGRLAVNESLVKPVTENNLDTSKGSPQERILREIVNLSLKGEEEFLREESTAEIYGLSRSSVREICHRMAGQGLLEHIPRRGWKVRKFSQQDLEDYSQAREALELKALELAWGKMLDVDLQEMRDGNIPAATSEDDPVIDNRLHAYMIEKAENHYIKDFFSRQEPFFKILFEWEGEDRDAAHDAIHQHHEILDAIMNRDKEAAKKALVNHIHHNHPVLKNLDIYRNLL